MSTVMTTTIETMITFLAFFITGMVLSRGKMVPDNAGKTISKLITLLFLPAMCFNSFATTCSPEKIRAYGTVLLVGLGVMGISVLIAIPVTRAFKGTRIEKLAILYTLIVPNYGFVGGPLILAVYGQETVANFWMFTMGFNFIVYCYLYPKYVPNAKGGAAWRGILNPSFICIVAGILYGLLRLPYPKAVQNVFTTASSCTAPCAMLVAGLTVGKLPLKRALGDPRSYLLVALRLVILPLCMGAMLYAACRLLGLGADVFMLGAIFVMMPMGLNPVVFAESFGEDSTFASGSAFISTLLSMLSIPLLMLLAERLSAAL